MSTTYTVTIKQKPTPSTRHRMLEDGDPIIINDTEAILPFQTLANNGFLYISTLYTLSFDPGGTSTLTCHPGQEDRESTETFTATDGGQVDTGPKLFRGLLRKLWRALMRLFRR